jgi:hypothetical protein
MKDMEEKKVQEILMKNCDEFLRGLKNCNTREDIIIRNSHIIKDFIYTKSGNIAEDLNVSNS